MDENTDGDEHPKPLRGIILGGDLPAELRDMLSGGFSMMGSSITDSAPVKDYTRSLVSMAAMMDAAVDYGLGEIVRFKPGLNHTRLTSDMIVRRMLPMDEAVRGTQETAYAGYCDLQNVVVGVIVNNGHYHEFMVDGRRIEKVPADELN